MTLRPGLFVSGPTGGIVQPQDARLALAGLLSGTGVLNGGAVAGSSSGPNMKYTVAAGVFVTARGSASADGLYVFANDGTVTVDSGAPAPGAGTRWDLIWVRHKNGFDGGFGDPDSAPAFGVTVGTVSSTPTKPYSSVPTGALVLAESNVGTSIPNSSTAAIAQVASTVFAAQPPDPSWIALPIVAGVEQAPSTYPCAYRVWPNGKVELRGGIQRSGTATFLSTAVLFNLPAGAQPASICRFSTTGTVSAGVTENCRLEITTDGVCKLWAADNDYKFLTLDGLYFYTS